MSNSEGSIGEQEQAPDMTGTPEPVETLTVSPEPEEGQKGDQAVASAQVDDASPVGAATTPSELRKATSPPHPEASSSPAAAATTPPAATVVLSVGACAVLANGGVSVGADDVSLAEGDSASAVASVPLQVGASAVHAHGHEPRRPWQADSTGTGVVFHDGSSILSNSEGVAFSASPRGTADSVQTGGDSLSKPDSTRAVHHSVRSAPSSLAPQLISSATASASGSVRAVYSQRASVGSARVHQDHTNFSANSLDGDDLGGVDLSGIVFDDMSGGTGSDSGVGSGGDGQALADDPKGDAGGAMVTVDLALEESAPRMVGASAERCTHRKVSTDDGKLFEVCLDDGTAPSVTRTELTASFTTQQLPVKFGRDPHNAQALVVQSVKPGSGAAVPVAVRDGRVRRGSRIVAVNGRRMDNLTFEQVRNQVERAGRPLVLTFTTAPPQAAAAASVPWWRRMACCTASPSAVAAPTACSSASNGSHAAQPAVQPSSSPR